MPRPSKLTPAQWAEVERRLMAGETTRALGAEFGLAESAIRKRFGAHKSVSAQSAQVRTVAQKLAAAQEALEELPTTQQQVAIDLAAAWRRMGASVLEAAALGADTGQRLHKVANLAAQQLDMGDLEQVKVVAATARTANEAMASAMQLLGQREKMRSPEDDEPPAPGLPVAALSTEALSEIMRAKDAADRG